MANDTDPKEAFTLIYCSSDEPQLHEALMEAVSEDGIVSVAGLEDKGIPDDSYVVEGLIPPWVTSDMKWHSIMSRVR